jgi:hypothetical protein
MECILTTYYRDKDGYGVVKFQGRSVLAHRLAFVEANGLALSDIDGRVIRHKCDNPSCVNPMHLEPGTNADNQQDKVDRNRQAKGVNNGRAKLTETDVRRIRDLLLQGGSLKKLAAQFSVAPSLIVAIKYRRLWKHVE